MGRAAKWVAAARPQGGWLLRALGGLTDAGVDSYCRRNGHLGIGHAGSPAPRVAQLHPAPALCARRYFPPHHPAPPTSTPPPQASQAVLRAWEDGVRQQCLELPLPLNNAPAEGGWPGGIRQQYRVALPILEGLLLRLKKYEGLRGRITAEWLDKADCVGELARAGPCLGESAGAGCCVCLGAGGAAVC